MMNISPDIANDVFIVTDTGNDHGVSDCNCFEVLDRQGSALGFSDGFAEQNICHSDSSNRALSPELHQPTLSDRSTATETKIKLTPAQIATIAANRQAAVDRTK